jgi:hypothetical protein
VTPIVARIALATAVAVAAMASPASGATLTFSPLADAHVRADAPARAFGAATALRVDGAPRSVALLRFRVRLPAGTLVTRARLVLAATRADRSRVTVRRVRAGRWRERSVTYARAPGLGPRVSSSRPSGRARRSVSLEVGPQVARAGTVDLAVTRASSRAVGYRSREARSGRPRLVVTTSPARPDPAGSGSTGGGNGPAPAPPGTLPPAPGPLAPGPVAFPVRAAFYYPWFAEAWRQNGIEPFTSYHPSLGFYASADDAVRDAHLRALRHARIDAGIYSWWGQGSKEDARFDGMLARTNATGGTPRWALYHEREGNGPDPSAAAIASDLDHIRARYTADPAYLAIGGRPVIFVYADAGDGCAMADRWRQANASRGFFVVLKVFSGYRACAAQPDGWHQYAPSSRTDRQAGFSFAISPEFDLTGPDPPRLARDLEAFRAAVRAMVASGEPWQLVTTFNEWGENSATESAAEWASPSGFGHYLDALSTDGR